MAEQYPGENAITFELWIRGDIAATPFDKRVASGPRVNAYWHSRSVRAASAGAREPTQQTGRTTSQCHLNAKERPTN